MCLAFTAAKPLCGGWLTAANPEECIGGGGLVSYVDIGGRDGWMGVDVGGVGAAGGAFGEL